MKVWLLWAIHGEPELAGIASSEENAIALKRELGGDISFQKADVDAGVSELYRGLKFWHVHFWLNVPSDTKFYAIQKSLSFLEEDSDDHFYVWAPTKERAFQEASSRFRSVGGEPEKYQL